MPQLTVNSTPQQLTSAGSGSLIIQNRDSSVSVFIAPRPTVTASGNNAGLEVRGGGDIELPLGSSSTAPFVVCAAGQTAVIAWEVW